MKTASETIDVHICSVSTDRFCGYQSNGDYRICKYLDEDFPMGDGMCVNPKAWEENQKEK